MRRSVQGNGRVAELITADDVWVHPDGTLVDGTLMSLEGSLSQVVKFQ